MQNIELKTHLKNLEKKLAIAYGIGFLILITLSLFSNFILKEQAAKQATSLIKRTVQRGDYREVIYTLNDAKLDYFQAVIYYSEDGNKLFSLPAELDPEFRNQKSFFSRFLYTNLSIDLFFDSNSEHKIGTVLFVFGRFSHIPYAFLIWLFFVVSTMPLIRSSRLRVTENHNKQMLLLEEATRVDLARRVRHDIRSPLGALQIATKDIPEVNQKQRKIIQRATERITEIVSELELIRVSQNEKRLTATIESPAPQSILTIAQDILLEKRTQLAYKLNIHLMPDFSENSFFLFAMIKGSEFKRTLSNIIDNAVEACHGTGRITVRLTGGDSFVRIDVIDNGHGIAEDDLERVVQKGFTKKSTGSGLGLYYSVKTIQEAQGTLSIKSKQGAGTTVSIQLPSCPPPSWYVPSIKVPINGNVVILDDQESIHLSWKLRLDALKTQEIDFQIICLTTPLEFIEWHHKHKNDDINTLYLLDYDLGIGQKNGLDIVRELNLNKSTILVTGHFDLEDIQKQCSHHRIGLLPKSYLSQIQLQAF